MIDLIVGNLYLSDSCTVWNTTSVQSPGMVIDHLVYDERIVLLGVQDEEFKVLTPRGKVGWIAPRGDGRCRLRAP